MFLSRESQPRSILIQNVWREESSSQSALEGSGIEVGDIITTKTQVPNVVMIAAKAGITGTMVKDGLRNIRSLFHTQERSSENQSQDVPSVSDEEVTQ